MAGIARRVGVLVLLLLGAGTPSLAQNRMPAPKPLEALVKGTLMSLNDANLTGDYRVFYARLSEPFRNQFPPDKLKTSFKEFYDKNVDIDIVTTMTPIYEQPPYVEGDGRLLVRGHFATEPTRVCFEMDFVMSDEEWKLLRINVTVGPSADYPPDKPAEPEKKAPPKAPEKPQAKPFAKPPPKSQPVQSSK
jgi:hypothetical protein